MRSLSVLPRIIALLFTLQITAAFAEQVVVSEIMYHPLPGKPEYIELWNITATPLDTALWKFSDGIDFAFPNFNPSAPSAHILLPFERIIISSATSATTRTAYPGIPAGVRIFGPWSAGTLDNSGERITVKDKNGVIVCSIEYNDQGKWPVAPDGTGHSLVLTDENRAIDDWRLWRSSRNRNGSPGVPDPALPAPGLALNEVHFSNLNGHVDWIELRNNSSTATQSASSLFLASTVDFSDKIALSGSVTANSVTSFNVDFTPDNGGEIRLYLIDTSNNVLDAVRLVRVPGRDSHQVFPPASRVWYHAVADTRNLPNNPARNTDIVIHEIMADPPSNQRDGEFVELYNKGAVPVDLSGWRLDDDVEFTFPTGTTIPANGYLVVGANAAWLNAHYAGLSALGNFNGSLSNNGDRVQLKDAFGNLADEVDFRFGGEWPPLAAGEGSSLELAHPEADNSIGSAWRDSDESAKSTFTPFSIPGGTYRRLSHGGVTDDEILLWLVGDGHVIFRNASLQPSAGGANLFVNAGVTTLGFNNIAGWMARGNHWASFHDAEGVHLLSDGGGDNKVNHAEKDATGMVANTAYTLNFEARWIYGKPRIVAQSWDLSWGGTAQVPIPANLGTPGAPNSRFTALAPPEVSGLRHSPATPPTNSTVTVTAKVSSSSPLTSVQLFHRLDNTSYNGTWNTTPMADGGTGGDTLANDGTFTAQVPLSSFGYNSVGSIVEFYVRATASNGQTADLPRGSTTGDPYPAAQLKTGLWVVDNQAQPADLRRLRIVISNYHLAALNTPDVGAPGNVAPSAGGGSADFNYKFPKHNSHFFPCTIIHNDSDVVYGAGVHKSGSPFTRDQSNSLTRGRIQLPGDRTHRGHRNIYWDNDGAGGSMLHNRVHRYLLYLCGVPGNENEVLRVTRNRDTYAVRETNEVFDKDMLNRIWPNGNAGYFFENDDAHAIGDDGNHRLNSIETAWDYNINNRPGPDNPVSYHNNFVPGSRESEYDFSTVIEWCRQIEANSINIEQLDRMADIRAMAAYAAVRGYSADWDSITLSRAKNGYFYNRPDDHRWLLIHWDSDNAFQPGRINEPFIGSETNVLNFYGRGLVRRHTHYYMSRLMNEWALNGPRLTAWLAAEEAASGSYTVPSTYHGWPNAIASTTPNQTRVQVMQAFMGPNSLNATFSLTNPPVSTASTLLNINGKAPPGVFNVVCLGHPEATLHWMGGVTDTSPWSLLNLRLANGPNTLTFRAFDEEGLQVGADLVHNISKTNNSPPAMFATVNPSSQNIALGEPLVIDAASSFDPEGGPLTFNFAVSPAIGFSMTSPTSTSRALTFNTPGAYVVTITGTDNQSTAANLTVPVTAFSSSDFNSFGDDILDPVFTAERVALRDNSSSGNWYSLNETSGSLVLNVTDTVMRPLTNSAPQFPLITRPLPPTGDWTLQTEVTMETRQFGAFLTGLFLETTENGILTRYTFGFEGGTNWKVYKANGPAGSFQQVAIATYVPPSRAMRIRRSGATLAFEVRGTPFLWTSVFTVGVAANNPVNRGGIFTTTGPVGFAPTQPGVGVRTAFDYLLLSNPANVADLVNSIRITEIMYHPADTGPEFVELRNIGASPVNLNGAYFADGDPFSAQFTFGNTSLQPGQFCVVTSNSAAFIAKYGNSILIAGEFQGSLNNDGENIVLNDPTGNPIHDFDYSNLAPWPLAADGFGPSMEPISTAPNLYGNGTNWRASQEIGGSPGYLGFGIDSDSDGSPDSVETAFGSDPHSGASTPAPPAATRDEISGGITITWNSIAGRSYTIEYRNSILSSDAWAPLHTLTATGATTSHTDTSALGIPIRFYRIKTLFP